MYSVNHQWRLGKSIPFYHFGLGLTKTSLTVYTLLAQLIGFKIYQCPKIQHKNWSKEMLSFKINTYLNTKRNKKNDFAGAGMLEFCPNCTHACDVHAAKNLLNSCSEKILFFYPYCRRLPNTANSALDSWFFSGSKTKKNNFRNFLN